MWGWVSLLQAVVKVLKLHPNLTIWNFKHPKPYTNSYHVFLWSHPIKVKYGELSESCYLFCCYLDPRTWPFETQSIQILSTIQTVYNWGPDPIGLKMGAGCVFFTNIILSSSDTDEIRFDVDKKWSLKLPTRTTDLNWSQLISTDLNWSQLISADLNWSLLI